MKIDFTKPIVNRQGKEIQPGLRVADVLADALSAATKGPAVKYWGWVQELTKSGVLELDKADTQALRQFIDNNEALTILAKGQLLDVLDKSNV